MDVSYPLVRIGARLSRYKERGRNYRQRRERCASAIHHSRGILTCKRFAIVIRLIRPLRFFGVLVAGIALFFLDPDGILYEMPRAAVNWVGGFDISAATSEFLQLR